MMLKIQYQYYLYKMIRKLQGSYFKIAPLLFKRKQFFFNTMGFRFNSLVNQPKYCFCNKNNNSSLNVPNIPKQNLQIKHTQAQVGQEEVDAFKTKGAISILDHIKGAKNTETGQLYALMFTCGKCNTKAIRSFTKNAYHKGVVLIRCEGCQNIHLVADNIGWFGPDPKNLQNMGEGKVEKVHDPVAITRFLKAAFEQSSPSEKVDKNQSPKVSEQNKKQVK